MTRCALGLVVAAIAVAAGCAPAVEITGAVQLGKGCAPRADAPPLLAPVLDIGVDRATANPYVAALTVTNYAAGVVTFDHVESFFSVDGQKLDALTPRSEATAARVSIGATSAAPVVVAPVVNRSGAVSLQEDPVVAGLVSSTPAGADVVVHVRLDGTTENGAGVRSQWFPLPLTVCASCLTLPPDCGASAPVANPAVCVAGDDVPSFVCR